ncbi:MAG: DUF4136 domain-containing protein [Lutibacter sp.]|uniref:DUF4136 domain-containing protein n=1 Tax=Lutibacter sp. TaxID=1925666 RepID=UPI0017B4F1D6|nr:DUF4136 domain-containing protein [Lutibacter sp.]MBT8318435.1 DUF4136 domain-containing protein [Lutibacter sp.]NNJ59293.1 DUF4136 domain-containing protein [Lutibacter sp.]
MKAFKLLPVAFLFLLASCGSVRVSTDYDSTIDFTKYKTFAFYKKGIDKVEISDLDKRRILKAVESELLALGFTKSEQPDVLVNIFTKSREKIDIYNNNNNMFFGWHPWYYGPNFGTQISQYTEGTLFIDLIDANKKELAWQGIGSGALSSARNMAKKEERIKEFVTEIMAKYPPGKE